MVSASVTFSGFIAALKHNANECAIIYDAVYRMEITRVAIEGGRGCCVEATTIQNRLAARYLRILQQAVSDGLSLLGG